MPLVLCSVRILHLPRDRAAVLCKPGGSQGNGGRGWEHSVLGVEHHWAGQGTGAKARLRCPCTGIPLAERSLCAGVKGCPFSVHAQNPNILNQEAWVGKNIHKWCQQPLGTGPCCGLSPEGQHRMAFVLLGRGRVSQRDTVFQEMVSNTLTPC